MLVYTDNNKYIILDAEGKNSINTLDDIQHDLNTIYPRQIFDSPFIINKMFACSAYHIILDIHNLLHMITIVNGVPILHKHFSQVITKNAAIVHSSIMCDLLEGRYVNKRISITIVDVFDKIIMYNTICYISQDGYLYNINSTKKYEAMATLNGVYGGYISTSSLEQPLEVSCPNNDTIMIDYDGEILYTDKVINKNIKDDMEKCSKIKCYDLWNEGITYTHNETFYIHWSSRYTTI